MLPERKIESCIRNRRPYYSPEMNADIYLPDTAIIYNINNYNIYIKQLNVLVDDLKRTFPKNASKEDKEKFDENVKIIQNLNSEKSLVEKAIDVLKAFNESFGLVKIIAEIAKLLLGL